MPVYADNQSAWRGTLVACRNFFNWLLLQMCHKLHYPMTSLQSAPKDMSKLWLEEQFQHHVILVSWHRHLCIVSVFFFSVCPTHQCQGQTSLACQAWRSSFVTSMHFHISEISTMFGIVHSSRVLCFYSNMLPHDTMLLGGAKRFLSLLSRCLFALSYRPASYVRPDSEDAWWSFLWSCKNTHARPLRVEKMYACCCPSSIAVE